MDYGRPVQFGYFIIPDATQPTFITSPDAGEAFMEEVVPKVRKLVAAGREQR